MHHLPHAFRVGESLPLTPSARFMFSVDYPYENMDEAADWIETCDLSEDDRYNIAYGHAQKLLKL